MIIYRKARQMMGLAPAALLIALGGLLAGGPALAQDDPPPAVLDFLKGDKYSEMLWVALHRAEKTLRDPTCQQMMTGADRQGIVIVEPLQIEAGQPFPSSGIWSEQLVVTLCGVSIMHNIRFLARAQGAPKPVLLLPGETIASPQLQRDTVDFVIAAPYANGAADEPCGEYTMLDTSAPSGLDGGELDLDVGWMEIWTIRLCGQSYRVPVTFLTQEDGSTVIKTSGALE